MLTAGTQLSQNWIVMYMHRHGAAGAHPCAACAHVCGGMLMSALTWPIRRPHAVCTAGTQSGVGACTWMRVTCGGLGVNVHTCGCMYMHVWMAKKGAHNAHISHTCAGALRAQSWGWSGGELALSLWIQPPGWLEVSSVRLRQTAP